MCRRREQHDQEEEGFKGGNDPAANAAPARVLDLEKVSLAMSRPGSTVPEQRARQSQGCGKTHDNPGCGGVCRNGPQQHCSPDQPESGEQRDDNSEESDKHGQACHHREHTQASQRPSHPAYHGHAPRSTLT